METEVDSDYAKLSREETFRRESACVVARVTEAFSVKSLQWQSEPTGDKLREEITKMSEKKAKELFEKDEDRKRWIDSIRKSVEQNLQTQVRAALGTPPEEKKKRQYLKKVEEERKQINEKALKERTADLKCRNSTYEDYKEDYLRRRQQNVPNYDYSARVKSTYSEHPNRNLAANLDPFSSEYNKFFSPYTKAALENTSTGNIAPAKVLELYKRSPPSTWIDSQGKEHDVPGPFWPKDHTPLLPSQSHVSKVPNTIEPLNSMEENVRHVESKDNLELFPRPWRGSMVVYDRTVLEPCSPAPATCPPHLKFESRFECGNLQQAKRIGRYEYDLVLSNDLYTKRHTQWYYFRVENMVPGVTYKFNIINLLKRDSLYNYGMKPLLYSSKVAEDSSIDWQRSGHHVNYTRTVNNKNVLLSRDLIYFTLTFQVEFPHAGDTCYLAHCYPYSYSDLERYLMSLVDNPLTSQHVRREVLCKTKAGNNCYVLTITSSQVPDRDKLGVVISARVHPGETNASWMMKGLLDYLSSNDKVAESLRQKFVFKIVPMLNPDGVIVGNYRTNLAARDLNRTYKDPKKESFPTVWYTKNMLESFKKNHEVIIYCDLHGHSRKPNVFMYGCTADPKVYSSASFLEERLFPWMMSQKAPDKFSFQGCKFLVRKCKESTARVVMWQQLGIMNSFTMEATFCGSNFGDMEGGRHFNTRDFEDMGRHFCEVLLEYSEAKSANRNEMTQAFIELACKMTRDILRQTLGSYRTLSDPQPPDEKTTEKSEDEPTITLQSLNNGTSEALTIKPRARGVNFVDVDVRKAQGAEPDGKGYDVSVKSVHVDSFNDCLKILEGLNLVDRYEESDSSDSDSEDEDSLQNGENDPKNSKNSEGKRKKKKKKKKQNWWDTLSSVQEGNKNKSAEEEANKNSSEKKIKTNFGKFVNPYANRFNNGIPTYSEERSLERARRKEKERAAEEREKRQLEAQFATEDPLGVVEGPMFAFADDTELNFVTAQRRLTYYMMNQRSHAKQHAISSQYTGKRNLTVLPSQRETLQVDSVKMDSLPGGGYGFAMRFPSRAQGSVLPDHQSPGNSARPLSLKSFEEARSPGARTPEFVEVAADEMIARAPTESSSPYTRYPSYKRNNKSESRMDLETMFRLVNNPSQNIPQRDRNRTPAELSPEKPGKRLDRTQSEHVFPNYRTPGEDSFALAKRAHELRRRTHDGSTPAIRSPARVIDSSFSLTSHDGSPELIAPDVIPSYSFVSSRRPERSPNSVREPRWLS
ncbi:uncharacterized protein LOC5514750 isoform X2 [Nematostella vectensis]|uniref:uncharacterized protein LOC5514750 isoform X2 n=1 Tax=Nematostella vectensis TaxID=45351 RepID=UPI002076D95E|nr:uncharacterized protein LOC5514750 isoform X2 [Nematostella vectensis]